MVCMWKLEDNLRWLSSPSTSLEQGLLVVVAAAHVKISWLSNFWGLSCLCLLSHYGSTRITHTYFYAWLYVGFEDSNTSLHAYIKYYMFYPMIPLLSIFVVSL